MRRLVVLRETIRDSWWGMILREHDTEPTEFAGALLKIGLGWWLALPWETFAASNTFRVLAILPEWLWAVSFIGLGLFHLHALREGWVRPRQVAALISFLMWFSLGAVFVWSNPPAIGWLLFVGAALAQMWVSIRLGSQT